MKPEEFERGILARNNDDNRKFKSADIKRRVLIHSHTTSRVKIYYNRRSFCPRNTSILSCTSFKITRSILFAEFATSALLNIDTIAKNLY